MKRFCILFLLLALTATAAEHPKKLSLDEYLKQVIEKHHGIRGAKADSEGKERRSHDGELLLAPVLFFNYQLLSDSKPTTNPSFQGSSTRNDSYSFGVSKLTRFGLQTKLSYNVNYTSLSDVNPTFIPEPSFYDAKPLLELTQSLWRNGFGSEIQATLELQQSSLLSQSYSQKFQTRLRMAEAEGIYWKLVVARETVKVQQETLDRASKMKVWSQQRVQYGLADKVDLLQADAAFQLRELELQSALDEERATSVLFNSLLGISGKEVKELLMSLDEGVDPRAIDTLVLPVRGKAREDVEAAAQVLRSARASHQLYLEKNSPTFELFGTAALNGRNAQASSALGNSLSTTNPTWAVGIRFSTPLEFGLLANNKIASAKEREGAELTYQRKQLEHERDWDELTKKSTELKRRVSLSLKIENGQKEKISHERTRHKKGRTTTFQVLLFEQDFATAQLARIRLQAELLKLIAEMRTYGDLS